MSGQNVKGKSKYESPILVPLGEMAKGSGVCETGSSVAPVSCSPGAADTFVLDCTAGLTATRDCTAGTAALRNCTAGVSALPACTMGTAATGACTAGGHVA
jgi:hypothetical protein